MPSSRGVPYLQPVYDLWRAEVHTDPVAAEKVIGWSRRTGLALPAAVWEFYTSVVHIPQYDDEAGSMAEDAWVLPLTELWWEYNPTEGPLRSLEEVLVATERAWVAGDPPAGLRKPATPVPAECGPLVNFEREVHRTLMCCFDAATPGDPAVWTYSAGGDVPWGEGWGRESATFSGWLLDWFASYYHEGYLPLSIFGPTVESEPVRYPVQPYGNGLWAYAVDRPVPPSVIAELAGRYGDPDDRAPADGAAARYCWDMPDGVVAVTTDLPDNPVGVSSWWVHGDSTDRFADLLRSVWGYGRLADTLVNSRFCAGHAQASAVLAAVRDTA